MWFNLFETLYEFFVYNAPPRFIGKQVTYNYSVYNKWVINEQIQ